METLRHLIDLFLHVDKHLAEIIASYGTLTYVILFLIVFCETGLVVTPFLPGDSLLFATGALCVERAEQPGGNLSVAIVIPLLIVAAVLGDAVNYSVGYKVGPGFLEREKVRFIKMAHLRKTQRFYEKHGGKTIVLARFMPIIRTFAPFVAGIGRMEYRRFGLFNITGGITWVTSFTLLGYFFGNLPQVKKNFTYVIVGIIVLSVLPMVIELIKARKEEPEEALGGGAGGFGREAPRCYRREAARGVLGAAPATVRKRRGAGEKPPHPLPSGSDEVREGSPPAITDRKRYATPCKGAFLGFAERGLRAAGAAGRGPRAR